MERLARFVFGTTTFDATISARAWTPRDATVGGSRTAASGVPASYIVRRDALLDFRLRFWETEWPTVLNLVSYGQGKQALTWYPDLDDLDVSFSVYLEAPAPGEAFAPERDPDFPRTFELPMTLRGVGAAVPWADYFVLSGA